jgi:cytochrome c556
MLKKITTLFIAATTLCAGLAATQAVAQASAQQALADTKYRQSTFSVIGRNMGTMGAMAQGKAPYDKERFAKSAEVIALLATIVHEGFTPGSDKTPTKAKPEIWTKMDDFKAKLEKFKAESAKLSAVSRTAPEADLFKQFGATGATCKACHDEYQSKEVLNKP